MPNLDFTLPHWAYWAGLLIFPLIAMAMVSRSRRHLLHGQTSLGVGYLTLITAGFIGMHRFYVRSVWGLLYLVPFVGILFANIEGRGAREDLSRARNQQMIAEFDADRLRAAVNAGKEGAAEKLAAVQERLAGIQDQFAGAQQSLDLWDLTAGVLALVILAGLIVDAFLLPRMVRRIQEREDRTARFTEDRLDPPPAGTGEDPTLRLPARGLTYWIDRLSQFSGEFVAYWSVIAVFVYYYEVVARYVFNSPTNWVHESMFLMFGMQYLISGAYAYLNDSHVRVDVFYARLSDRGKALSDLLTSVFFFIFAGTMLVTGWTFMMDSVRVWEVSFTEWAIQYWPVKITITAGAALLLLQGLSKLAKDVTILATAER